MRVISGFLGGRSIQSPKKNRTHPMSDKMRGGLFATLGDIEGLEVLDAYSGSGALAIEAISRGAKDVVAVDIDKNAVSSIKTNISELSIDNKIKPVQTNINSYLNRNDTLYDLIFADPPYNDIKINHILNISRHLKNNATLVLSLPGHEGVLLIKGLKIVKNKTYGDSQLVFYKKIS